MLNLKIIQKYTQSITAAHKNYGLLLLQAYLRISSVEWYTIVNISRVGRVRPIRENHQHSVRAFFWIKRSSLGICTLCIQTVRKVHC